MVGETKMKTKKQARLYMRSYLADPVNRWFHNNRSTMYYRNNIQHNKKVKAIYNKKHVNYNKKWQKKNKLTYTLYMDFNYLLQKEEYPHLNSMYSTLLELVRKEKR